MCGENCKKRNNEIITIFSHAHERYSVLATGVDTYAIWEFEQGNEAERRGQYDLQIIAT